MWQVTSQNRWRNIPKSVQFQASQNVEKRVKELQKKRAVIEGIDIPQVVRSGASKKGWGINDRTKDLSVVITKTGLLKSSKRATERDADSLKGLYSRIRMNYNTKKQLDILRNEFKKNDIEGQNIVLSNVSQPPKIVYKASKLQTDINTQTQKNNITEVNIGSNRGIQNVYRQSDEETIAQWTNQYHYYYGLMGNRLRKGKELNSVQYARFNKLKDVLSRTPEYKDTVYKGLDFNKKEYGEFVNQIERGKISFPTFSGATKYKEYPKEFLERFTLRSRNKHIVLKIKNPKANDIKDYVGQSRFGDEGEVILSPSEYYVEHVEWKKNKTGLQAEVTINSKNQNNVGKIISDIPLKRSTLPSVALKNLSKGNILTQNYNVSKTIIRSSTGKRKVTKNEFNKFAQSEHRKALKNIEEKLGVKIDVPLKVMKNPSVYTDGTPVPSHSKFALGQGSAAVQAKKPFITVGTEQAIIDVTKQTRKELGDKNWNKKVGVKSMVKYVVQHENLHHVYPQLTESQKKRVYQYIKDNKLLTEYGQRSRREEGVIDAFTNLLLRKELREGEFKKLKREEIQKHLFEMKRIIKK